VALLLKRRGVERVRPLAGGFDAWIAAGHPTVAIETTSGEPAASPYTPPRLG
jgi:3-mercaptopyruvate sulfurtransferase SseA